MPGPLLHLNATVTCAHAGRATPTLTSPRVTLSGQPVALAPGPWIIAGCALPPPPSGNGPCVTGSFTTAATRVASMGMPVLLLDSQGSCAPTGTPILPIAAQTRVTGM